MAPAARRKAAGASGSPRGARVPSAELRRLVSAICLGLPETTADDAHPPHRGFSVGGRSFAYYTLNEHGDGRVALVVRAEPGVSAALVAADPDRFALPKYVARHGWVTYYLDLSGRPPDWDQIEALVRDSYRIQASARLRRQLSSDGGSGRFDAATVQVSAAEVTPRRGPGP